MHTLDEVGVFDFQRCINLCGNGSGSSAASPHAASLRDKIKAAKHRSLREKQYGVETSLVTVAEVGARNGII